jgi:pantoate--beta-alanine ligase
MGALHKGHLSLAEQSKQNCDRTVVTIFVNPSQFGPHEDLRRYPRTLQEDLEGLQSAGVDLVLTPEVEHIYPKGFSTYVQPPDVAEPLEGQFRPGHFRGVATVVLKLFQIIPATVAYFGRKDYQQLAVIKQMVSDLNVPIRIEGCKTVREEDGLAMSSRNRYLSSIERGRALCLWRALQAAQSLYANGERNVARLEKAMLQCLDGDADQVQYARVVDAESLQTIDQVDSPAVALIAAYVGSTRLIDNWQLEAT